MSLEQANARSPQLTEPDMPSIGERQPEAEHPPPGICISSNVDVLAVVVPIEDRVTVFVKTLNANRLDLTDELISRLAKLERINARKKVFQLSLFAYFEYLGS